MNRIYGALLVSLFSWGASAQQYQSVEQTAWLVAQEIQSKSHTLTGQQKAEISHRLNEIRRLLNSSNPYPPAPPPPNRPPQYGENHTCVARDNDDRAPYAIAIREGINVVRLPIIYRTMAQCQEQLKKASRVHGSVLVCGSRDKDGVAPFIVNLLHGTNHTELSHTVVRTMAECDELVSKIRPGRDGKAALCLSRDRDGKAPYVPALINVRNGQTEIGSEVFRNVYDCWAFINH